MRRTVFAALSLLSLSPLAGCVVAGYSSRGGFFIWPGTFVLFIFVLILVLLLRRR